MLPRVPFLSRIFTHPGRLKIPTCLMRPPVRSLNVHEHVAYKLLKEGGIPTPKFGVAKTPDEASKYASDLNTQDIVLKAQVLAGGRGKGFFKGSNIGGVKMCETPEEAKDLANKMLGKLLVTKQTGADGRICNAVMVTTRMYPRREFYLAVLLERTFGGPVVIASSQGGVDIEEVAATNPNAITYEPIDIEEGISGEQAERIAVKMGLETVKNEMAEIICNLYELFLAKDALLLEINPFAEDMVTGNYVALDCKCRFDDNAEFRQKELFALRDWTQEDPREVAAAKYDLNYIALDGNIGCMVNGAGLAMATMDIIKLNGGDPANFLDLGGGATLETVKEAFKIITSDPKVDAILVNIFGGIMKCDIVAQGLIAASTDLKIDIPIVVRLQGTNVKEAKALMAAEKDAKIVSNDDLSAAAYTVVTMSKIVKLARSINVKLKMEVQDEDKSSGRKKCQ
ncbi:succinate--CoA ligase [ADP-forming] subunit beta, mitochondrial-like [Neodiprion lecontei]|uniref:Succinate--CoA ligase [ADP-forming] subunit beta, mitochondrial n=1 Tax=Neodiprion lecontei TaxID=441921 RepID=A0A6J0C7E4_NEOLC|nr:succinate--CoA ligase [ADP-forming] subunit beta, mitochondrial-like [Neodiprion lecontei]